MKGVTPILAAVPPASTMDRPDGPHSGNPAVREAVKNGEIQTMSWAYERPGGGRGFGFTGAHYHKNYGNENLRKVILNSILWIAHAEDPAKRRGMQCFRRGSCAKSGCEKMMAGIVSGFSPRPSFS